MSGLDIFGAMFTGLAQGIDQGRTAVEERATRERKEQRDADAQSFSQRMATEELGIRKESLGLDTRRTKLAETEAEARIGIEKAREARELDLFGYRKENLWPIELRAAKAGLAVDEYKALPAPKRFAIDNGLDPENATTMDTITNMFASETSAKYLQQMQAFTMDIDSSLAGMKKSRASRSASGTASPELDIQDEKDVKDLESAANGTRAMYFKAVDAEMKLREAGASPEALAEIAGLRRDLLIDLQKMRDGLKDGDKQYAMRTAMAIDQRKQKMEEIGILTQALRGIGPLKSGAPVAEPKDSPSLLEQVQSIARWSKQFAPESKTDEGFETARKLFKKESPATGQSAIQSADQMTYVDLTDPYQRGLRQLEVRRELGAPSAEERAAAKKAMRVNIVTGPPPAPILTRPGESLAAQIAREEGMATAGWEKKRMDAEWLRGVEKEQAEKENFAAALRLVSGREADAGKLTQIPKKLQESIDFLGKGNQIPLILQKAIAKGEISKQSFVDYLASKYPRYAKREKWLNDMYDHFSKG